MDVGDKLCNISDLKFKIIYLKFLNNKAEVREWEDKWVNNLHTDNINWGQIWQNQNNHIHNHRIKSALWEITHLNFWSRFKAGERCHLCNEVEDDSFHIIKFNLNGSYENLPTPG